MRKTTTPETAPSAGRNRMIMVILAFVISIVSVAAAPASATDGWIDLGNGAWVVADHNGGLTQAIVDNDADIFWDVYFSLRSDGSIEWIGRDSVGRYDKIETWSYIYPDGGVWTFVDANEDNKYELQYWDPQGDGVYDSVSNDTNGDGWANNWVAMTTDQSDSTDGGLGISILRGIFDRMGGN